MGGQNFGQNLNDVEKYFKSALNTVRTVPQSAKWQPQNKISIQMTDVEAKKPKDYVVT